MDSLGGNGGWIGAFRVVMSKWAAVGVGSYSNRLLSRDEDVDEEEGGIRSCTKCGMVAMNGDSAHGFVGEVRSCSSVGSMNLTQSSHCKRPMR